MIKTLTTYEALVANESRRVRGLHEKLQNTSYRWLGRGEMIRLLNKGQKFRSTKWEAENCTIPTNVPTLWSSAFGLWIVWPNKEVWHASINSDWGPSLWEYKTAMDQNYCGPLFVSKENEP